MSTAEPATRGPALTHVWWRHGLSRRGQTHDGLPAGNPAVGSRCPLCPDPVGAHEPTQLLVVGPDDEPSRELHVAGGSYRALAVLGHQVCVQEVADVVLYNVAVGLLAGEWQPCWRCGTRVTVVDGLRREHGSPLLHTADRCRAYCAANGQGAQ